MRWKTDVRQPDSSVDKCDPLRRFHDRLHRHHHEFKKYHRWFRYARPAVLIFNITILYLLFSWVGIKAIGLCFAGLIIIKEIVQFIFLLRLEKRIIYPIEQLRQGVNEIANGNYSVRVSCTRPNDLGLLLSAFNEMAEKLQHSEQLQAEYEENRKTLIANISHDLKTPITAIQGYIEALLEQPQPTDDTRQKYLQIVHRNIYYLNRLIDDLFLFSKLDMQKLEFHFQAVKLRNYLHDLMEEYQLELSEQQIPLSYTDMLTEEPVVELDARRFRQAIDNIIRNSVVHGPDSGLILQIKLYATDGSLAIDIMDNGPGIDAEKLPFIFDRFYRVDTARAKDVQSTGLGLAITRELIESHNGKVLVTSKVGEGSCFTILLPNPAKGNEI